MNYDSKNTRLKSEKKYESLFQGTWVWMQLRASGTYGVCSSSMRPWRSSPPTL